MLPHQNWQCIFAVNFFFSRDRFFKKGMHFIHLKIYCVNLFYFPIFKYYLSTMKSVFFYDIMKNNSDHSRLLIISNHSFISSTWWIISTILLKVAIIISTMFVISNVRDFCKRGEIVNILTMLNVVKLWIHKVNPHSLLNLTQRPKTLTTLCWFSSFWTLFGYCGQSNGPRTCCSLLAWFFPTIFSTSPWSL